MLLDILKFIFNTKPKQGNYAGKIFGTKITVTSCEDGIVTYRYSESACPEIRLMSYRQFHITGYKKFNEISYEIGEAIGTSCLNDHVYVDGEVLGYNWLKDDACNGYKNYPFGKNSLKQGD